MFTIDLRHVVQKQNTSYVLRLRNRVGTGSRSMTLTAGTTVELPGDVLPGPSNHTVVWIDEISSDKTSRALTPRFRLDALKGVARLEHWLRQPLRLTTSEEAAGMLETLAVWEHFGDTRWQNRLIRIVTEVNRKIQRTRSIPTNSRVSLLCQLHVKKYGFTDSLPGNVVASLAAILEMHEIFQKYAPQTGRKIEHISRPSSSTISEPLSEKLRTISETMALQVSPTIASHLQRGQVLSVIEGRAAALKEFRRALSSGPELIRSMHVDVGAFTYGFPEPSAERKQVDISWHGGDFADGAAVTILYSANVKFLRRYFARIVFYAAAEPGLQLHFHIVDPETETLEFIKEAKELMKAIHGFSRRQSKLPSLSWSSSRLPEGVGNSITYYACARYLVAQQVMDKFETDVWIQDVDLFPVSPISDSHDRFTEFDVIVAATTGVNLLAPWRRYLAGNVFLAQSDGGRQFAASAEDYIWTFLDRHDSWMLDQNALDWAVETASRETAIGNMSALGVGLTQSVMNGSIES